MGPRDGRSAERFVNPLVQYERDQLAKFERQRQELRSQSLKQTSVVHKKPSNGFSTVPDNIPGRQAASISWHTSGDLIDFTRDPPSSVGSSCKTPSIAHVTQGAPSDFSIARTSPNGRREYQPSQVASDEEDHKSEDLSDDPADPEYVLDVDSASENGEQNVRVSSSSLPSSSPSSSASSSSSSSPSSSSSSCVDPANARFQEQDERFLRCLSVADLRCVRSWRDTFVGVNKVLLKGVSQKWTRREMLHLLVQPVQPQDMYLATERLALPPSTVRRAITDAGGGETKPGQPPVGLLETSVTLEFFTANTFVRSGARTDTRRMAMQQTEMYALYRAHFPMLLRRAENLADGGAFGELPRFMSRQLARTKAMSEVKGWSPEGELKRREEWYAKRTYECKVDRARCSDATLQRIRAKDDPDDITARCSKTFWDIIERAKVKFLRSEPIYNCPIHDNAAKNRRDHAAAEDELAKVEKDLVEAKATGVDVARLSNRVLPLKHKIRDLRKAVKTADDHQIHYETARKYVKTIESNLKKGEVLLYRDFVNQYNENGKKIYNLVVVIIRPSPDGIGNIIDYVDHLAQTKCDAVYHAACMDLLFQRTDLFPRGTKVYISGDHGPHFWCWATLGYQSTVFKKFGLSLHIVGLCSYHAYNRCDAHGANIKQACRAAQLRGAGPTTPADFALMVNNMPAAADRGISVQRCLSTSIALMFLFVRQRISGRSIDLVTSISSQRCGR